MNGTVAELNLALCGATASVMIEVTGLLAHCTLPADHDGEHYDDVFCREFIR